MPDEIERKFLINRYPLFVWPVPCFDLHLMQIGLDGDNPEVAERIRRTTNYLEGEPQVSHEYTRKTKIAKGHSLEVNYPLTEGQFEALRESRQGPDQSPIYKMRRVFFIDGQKFELDFFLEPRVFVMLETELPSIDHPLTIPDWLGVEREVTGLPEFSNIAIGKHHAKRIALQKAGEIMESQRRVHQKTALASGLSIPLIWLAQFHSPAAVGAVILAVFGVLIGLFIHHTRLQRQIRTLI